MKLSVINTAVQSFLLHGDAFEQACIDLQRLFKGVARETVKETVCPMVSAYYVAKGVADAGYVDGKWEAKDGAAKKKANRLLSTICGTSSTASSAKTMVKLTRVQKAAVVALLAAFGGDAKAAKAAISA